MARWGWGPYVPVAKRWARAQKELEKMRKKGMRLHPVAIEGRVIARSFWGKGWCTHLESFSDYANRLPRGRTYVRNGSVCHLEIRMGEIHALVSGTDLYSVQLTVAILPAGRWTGIKERCTGRVGSILELLQGKLSEEVMAVVADRNDGLFPLPGEMRLACSCPDWATMCKHVAAVLYAVGHRLDTEPDLLFTLRGVDAEELISAPLTLVDSDTEHRGDTLEDAVLADLFGIEFDLAETPPPNRKTQPAATPGTSGRGRPRRGKAPGPAAESTIPADPPPSRTTQAKPARKTAAAGKNAATPSPAKAGSAARTRTRPFRPTGATIRKLRQQLGDTVEAFAERIGASAATVRRWEATRGLCRPHARLLVALQALAAI